MFAKKRILIPSSSIGIILLVAAMSLTCTGCGPTAEEIRAREGSLVEARRQAEEAQRAARSSAGLVRKEIQVDSYRIVYLEGGQGETVLLLHGYGGNKDMWTYFAGMLTPNYHIVIPDLAGFGESTRRWNENYSIDSQVKLFDRFAQVLQLKRFHLAGNSMGGAIAALYTARNPQKISTLALLDPYGLRTAKMTEFASQMQNGVNLFLIGSPDDFEKLLPYVFVKPPPLAGPIKEVMIAQMIADRKFNEKVGWDLFKEGFALEPLLPAIQAPVCIIWGDHDRIFDVSGASILEKGLKNHQTVIIKDTGHMPMVEKPAETAAEYMSFLKNQGSM